MKEIDQFISEPNDADFKTVVAALNSKSLQALELVEKLGPYLTSVDKDVRCNATRMLSECLDAAENLPTDDLSPLADFFCDRIKDHHSIVPHVLRAFAALTRKQQLPDYCAITVAKAIFLHAETQTLIQAHRMLAFQVISNLLKLKLEVLKEMREEFPLGYIQMIDGEKDPRVLHTVFSLSLIVINHFPIGVCCEDLFEVTSCYFPIDFTPPPGDKTQITRQDLSDKLLAVLSSTRLFAPYCIPLLIEKISSDLQMAKQDSFTALKECCQVYTVNDLRPFVKTLLQLMLKESMLSGVAKTEELALQALTAVAHCLSFQKDDGTLLNSDIQDFCSSILRDCKRYLFEPEHRMVVPAVKVLKALISSNALVSDLVLRDVIPDVLAKLNTSAEEKRKMAYLGIMEDLFDSPNSSIAELKQSVLSSVINLLDCESHDLIVAAVSCLKRLTDCLGNSLETVSKKLLDLFFATPSTSIRKVSTDCLAELCRWNISTAVDLVILPLCTPLTEMNEVLPTTLTALDAISQSCRASVVIPLLPHLMKCLRLCCKVQPEVVEAVLSSTACLTSCGPKGLDIVFLTEFMNICLADFESITPSVQIAKYLCDIILQLINSVDTQELQTYTDEVVGWLNRIMDLSSHGMAAVQVFICSLPEKIKFDELGSLRGLISLSTEVHSVQTIANKIISSTINKSSNPEALLEMCKGSLGTVSACNVYCYSWITKALLLRGHEQSQDYLTQVLGWFYDPSLSGYAAEAVHVIVEDYCDVFLQQQHANIRKLYKQRVFVTAFPKLHQMFSDISSELLPNVQLAVTYLIKCVPSQVLSNDKRKLQEVLLKLLSSTEELILLKTLEVLLDDPDLHWMEEHIDTFVPLFLKLTTFSSSMQVRILALRSLALLSRLSAIVVASHMNTIIKGLQPALNDKKRLVRKEAVHSINIWFHLRDGEDVG